EPVPPRLDRDRSKPPLRDMAEARAEKDRLEPGTVREDAVPDSRWNLEETVGAFGQQHMRGIVGQVIEVDRNGRRSAGRSARFGGIVLMKIGFVEIARLGCDELSAAHDRGAPLEFLEGYVDPRLAQRPERRLQPLPANHVADIAELAAGEPQQG